MHAEVWVVVVEVFQPLDGESVVEVVPQSFVLAAWAGARPNAAAIAVANATRTRFVALDVMADCPPNEAQKTPVLAIILCKDGSDLSGKVY